MNSLNFELKTDGIGILTFDLPGEKVNKLTSSVMEELDRALDDLGARKDIKALIIRSGKPDVFIAGADIAEIRDITDKAKGAELSRKGQMIFQKIEELPFPTVAAIQGACLGGGLELALACSYRVISNDAKTILGLPEIKLGIIPGFGGTQRLPRLVGIVNSLDMILTGKTVYPSKAGKIGLADEVTYKETLLSAAIRLAQKAIGRRRPSGIRARMPLFLRFFESNPLTRYFIFRKAKSEILRDTRGNYPAPLAALDAVQFGISRKGRAGYEYESSIIGSLIPTETSKNLINVFFLNEALKRETTPSIFSVKRAGVIGAGVMGGGIAQLFAEKGISVRIKDLSTKNVGTGLKAASELFIKRMKKGILSPLAARDGMDRISGTTDMSGFGKVEIAVEAVVENLEVKKSVLREFESVAHRNAIFASNTSSLSITELASAAKHPERVIGMHFFNPVEKMPLVEIVRGKETSPEVVAAVAALSRKLGKLPVIVNDGPGFLVNRILMPYLAEALRLLEEGASIEAVDRALMQFGMPMGAFILLDEIGIDVAYKVADIVHFGLGERIGRSPLLASLVSEGYAGRKNGKGFYRYSRGRREKPNQDILDRLAKQNGNRKSMHHEQEIVERTILLMIKEAALCLEEKIIDRPELLDAALLFGIGFPPFRGGLLKYADTLGAKTVVEKLRRYEEKLGERFSPPRSLVDMSRDDIIGKIVK